MGGADGAPISSFTTCPEVVMRQLDVAILVRAGPCGCGLLWRVQSLEKRADVAVVAVLRWLHIFRSGQR